MTRCCHVSALGTRHSALGVDIAVAFVLPGGVALLEPHLKEV
jgi:hypothetical protein